MIKVFYLEEGNVIIGYGNDYSVECTDGEDENGNPIYAVRKENGNTIFSSINTVLVGEVESAIKITIGLSKFIDGVVVNETQQGEWNWLFG